MRAPAPTPRLRSIATSVAIVCAVAAAWWFVLPAGVGGRSTYVVVNGRSMEPQLHTGELVVARPRAEYRIGDLVVVRGGGGNVVHRIVSGDERRGWRTRGDNNEWIDPWTVRPAEIVGRVTIEAGSLGGALDWIRAHPTEFATLSAFCGLALALPWRRRRVSRVLRRTLAASTPEPAPIERSRFEYAVLVMASTATLVAALSTASALGRNALGSASGLLALATLLLSSGSTFVLLTRMYDGQGAPEPLRSLIALSGRLRRVDALPEPPPGTPVRTVRSAVALRSIAERERLPVLHTLDPETGLHEFLLLTVSAGAYTWTAPDARDDRAPQGDPVGAGGRWR
ncbi:MAG: signal peptidase I [Actinomycetota bacterium]